MTDFEIQQLSGSRWRSVGADEGEAVAKVTIAGPEALGTVLLKTTTTPAGKAVAN